MGVPIARWILATLNVLLSFLFTTLFVVIVQIRSPTALVETSLSQIVYWSFYALLTVAAMMTAALLLRRRTVQAGLKLHFALAHVGLLSALVYVALAALGRPEHHVSVWVLQTAYWMGAVSGLWFGTGLTLKLLMDCEAGKVALDTQEFDTTTVAVAPLTTAIPGRPMTLQADMMTPEVLLHRRTD